MTHRLRSMHSAGGFTLIELMLSTLIGMLLIAGALRLLAQGRVAWQTAENVAALEERAAYALTVLEQDIRLAGYWGQHSDSQAVSFAPGLTVHCGGNDVSIWALALNTPVAADNNNFTLPCSAWSEPMPGADTLTIRHASQLPAIPEEGRIQLCTNQEAGVVFQTGTPPETTTATAEIYDIEIHAWHVVRDSSEPGSPALRRFALVHGGLMESQEIIPGVEDFQITLGVDRDGDGLVDGFIDPDATADASVMAVRFWLLLRSTHPEPGHIDAGPWHSIDTGATAPLRPADSYRRMTAQRTVWLRNRRGS